MVARLRNKCVDKVGKFYTTVSRGGGGGVVVSLESKWSEDVEVIVEKLRNPT
jgi:hypothetical protein